ncbi:WbuC family cupin fold metalloprotein [Herbaspirillum rubrisubalbicans]|uniref:Cupin fold metalloprotein, WbuC family n=1 Tax=Herbaspirillum rubrisubalbicans Os34 TaxID=1235827 RepID=A0A6M4A120_9BURK|nr:WbuC family cupin fold metalloprotein [Herbaspirillum rubrisubalbicans]QJQ03382.1 cupin fold metalloprotein, WbuC family [Herbaspirillum rubrisubalbicans Os34]
MNPDLRQYRFQNPEVIYSDMEVVTASRADILHLEQLSASNARQRVRLCAHDSLEDSLHEMLIVIQGPSAYVRPHKHPGKSESMHVISGRVDLVMMDDAGAVTQIIEMGDYASGLPFYERVDRPIFHTLIIRSDVLVFHEVTNGPFLPNATVFPDWAPDGSDAALAGRYVGELEQRIKSATEKQ